MQKTGSQVFLKLEILYWSILTLYDREASKALIPKL